MRLRRSCGGDSAEVGVDALNEAGAVSAVGQAGAAPLVGVAHEPLCISQDRRTAAAAEEPEE